MQNGLGLAVAAMVAVAGAGPAWGGASSYDLTILLDQPHPLALQALPRSAGTMPVAPDQIFAPARVPPQTAAPRPAARPMFAAPVAQAAPFPGDGGVGGRGWLGGKLSEIRIGVLNHDEGPFSSNEESGIDANLELLFVSPDFLRTIWSPRPHFGLTVNSDGDTSLAYLGLSWEWNLWRAWFAGFSLGGAVHTGRLSTNETDRKELGCRTLFRGSAEMGYRFRGRHAVSLFLDHISNAGLCDHNESLENFGVRYGYRF